MWGKVNTNKIFFHLFILSLLSAILAFGTIWKFPNLNTDYFIYQCDASLFWHGSEHLTPELTKQCSYLLQNHPIPPFTRLPDAYPILSIVPFSLGLILPFSYPISFALMMFVFVLLTYFLLLQYKSQKSAFIFALLLGTAATGTAFGRFDLFPSLITLLAVIFAQKKRWVLSFLLLACAVWFKFYPLVLVPFFTVALFQDKKKFLPLIVFLITNIVLFLVSLLINANQALTPLHYFQNRPIQTESLAASFVWLGSLLGFSSSTLHNFGSFNITSPLSPIVSIFTMIFLATSLVVIFLLQLKKRISLPQTALLVLIASILFSKIFSPQYLIWIIPLIAYTEKNIKIIVLWVIVGVLTSFIFPYLYSIYVTDPHFPQIFFFNAVVFARNILLLFVFAFYLWHFITSLEKKSRS